MTDLKTCPKCGKTMILCEVEHTYYQKLKCFRCGYEVGLSKHLKEIGE